MSKEGARRKARFFKSRAALAIPVTYLILFVSLLTLISATYSLAVVKIGARGALVKASVARQNMQFLDNAVHLVSWTFGSSSVVYMDDAGGEFRVDVYAQTLVINFTDDQTFSSVVFNSSAGKAEYELESAGSSYDDAFIRGDERPIVNQTSFTMTQLHASTSENSRVLTLSYRPSATSLLIGTSGGKPLNLIRVYIINLNSSENLALAEKFYLKITSSNVTTTTDRYEFNQSVSSLALKTVLDGTAGSVWLPIISGSDGAVVDVEIVTCNVRIEKAEVH